ncbi:hypothetical protein C8D88_114153 [Lentzea atacamensis]|uniref:Uncharacterized protein n=1 Tax=Lentzea atacamensis TaxID=531938 RepID=A0A316HNI6_9PSEU|nr:hypothetical protein [Lentzea atacamensis]PWK82284.1 hypothetical protein C8D88_114153 [Lentzea atacamensis]
MAHHCVEVAVQGPWSLATSRASWEGFTPSAPPARKGEALQSAFLVEGEWRRASVSVTQRGATAVLELAGEGDPDLAAAQVCRLLALDVDGRAWPGVGARDPVIAAAQASLPGLRPCGFYSPYEATAGSVLSQRVRVSQAAALKASLAGDGVVPGAGGVAWARPGPAGSQAGVEVSGTWRPYRTWTAVHLRALRERRIGGAMAPARAM